MADILDGGGIRAAVAAAPGGSGTGRSPDYYLDEGSQWALRPGAAANPYAPVTPSNPNRPSGGPGNGRPDWSSLIQQMSAAARARADAMRNNAGASRRAAMQALAVKTGGLLGGFKDQYGDIDAATMALMESNQFSDTKMLQKNYTDSQAQLRRQLAARRALGSGETQYGLDSIDQQRGQAEYNLGNDYMGQVNQHLGQYSGALEQAYGIEQEGMQEAAMRAMALGQTGMYGGGGGGGGVNTNAEPFASSGYSYDPNSGGLQVREPYDYSRGSDIRYFTPNYGANPEGWNPEGSGWISPEGTRLDEEGRVR